MHGSGGHVVIDDQRDSITVLEYSGSTAAVTRGVLCDVLEHFDRMGLLGQ